MAAMRCHNCETTPVRRIQLAGAAKVCGHVTGNVGNAFCAECAEKKGVCFQCGCDLDDPPQVVRGTD